MIREPVLITISHVRQAKMCAFGARAFCRRYDIDWSVFLKEGISSELLEATGDAMAMQVVEVAHGRR